MAGYHNYSMSNNAVGAYSRGLLPTSKAAKVWGFKDTKSLRACVHSSEWHHTSKEYNCTDFFDVEETIKELTWQELAAWKMHLNRRGWGDLKNIIRDKIRSQMTPEFRRQCPRKLRFERLMELANKYPTPYQRHNGLPAVESAMQGKELTETNYVAAKAIVDARREGERKI